MNAAAWIEEIVRTHHAYLKKVLPEITGLIQNATAPTGRKHEWETLASSFMGLKQELAAHILKEEVMLFPSILHMEAAVKTKQKPDLARHDLREALEQAEYDHDATEQFLDDIGKAMAQVGLAPETRPLFEKLEELKKDLKVHIHKEETGLFPEARFLYARATEGMLREE